MPSNEQACFDEMQFHRFLENEIDAKEEDRILAHIATCHECQSALEKLAGNDSVWSELKHHLRNNHADIQGEMTQDLFNRDQIQELQKVQNMLAPTDNPEMLGRLGSYEVCGVIGRGSAGIVVKALDTRLNRYVAIKLLAPAYSNIGCSRRRFEREGRAIASVKDPHVVPIHTVDEFQGTPYIVMQYMPDGSLLQRIQKIGPLQTSEVACVGMQIAQGLAAAHKRGIVHRDVKPANVLLDNGIVGAMVTDFGLARVVDEATMTHSGSISGTPQYMSPEQAKGERVDPKSDLFSLGSVMYAACTGHAPFKSESVFGVIKKVCESEPNPIHDFHPEIAPWLVAFISKLHAKNPQDRFASAQEVADYLSMELAHLQAPTIAAKPARPWWEKKQRKHDQRFLNSKLAKIGAGLAVASVAIVLGLFAAKGFGSFNSSGNDPNTLLANNSGANNPPSTASLLALAQQYNDNLPRFQNKIEKTIKVKPGGELFLRTNLGTLDVRTHEKPVVEMKLVYSVAAENKESAEKVFNAVKLDYGFDTAETRDQALVTGKDAAIVASFPTQKLTQKEIEQSVSLEELKEQLLIRNNSRFRNAVFQILVPAEFDLNLFTSAGPIKTFDVDGKAKLLSNGGIIETGSISGNAELETNGGHIFAGDLGANATLRTNGGDIEMGNVDGDLVAKTSGGFIRAESVSGTADVQTLGGNIEMGSTQQAVSAESMGGSISIWKAEDSVQANAPAGSITVNYLKQPTGDSQLKTGVGTIEVGYIDGLSLDIDASSGLGKVKAPFSSEKSSKLKHKMNEGEFKLAANSGNGQIRFQVVDEKELNQRLKEHHDQFRGRRAFQRAYDLHMEGKIDEAIEAHKLAAKFADYKAIATYNLGCAWALKGESDKAFAALNKAIDYGFDRADQFENDGDLDSLLSDDRFAKLLKRVQKVEVEMEDNDSVQELLARQSFEKAYELHMEGNIDEAIIAHQEAAKFKSYQAIATYNLGCAWALKGETEKAFTALENAIEFGFTDEEQFGIDEDLDSLRSDERFEKLMSKLKKAVKQKKKQRNKRIYEVDAESKKKICPDIAVVLSSVVRI